MLEIDLEAFRSSGVKAFLLDIDNTLLPRDTSLFPEELVSWTRGLSSAGFGVCFISNNWHRYIFEKAEEVGFPVVAKAMKPFPFAFLAGARALGVRTSECVVVGDQLFTDILGGNLVGATTVLVNPLSSSDLPHTLVLRRLERVIMGRRDPRS
ncbi:MAG: YqeG family HAD IIIA-type phosphatase [Coriobacteriia bacterium]|nr:YqeG family HAD IIIA-type phosphatase [Coriobacteriia bacterium]